MFGSDPHVLVVTLRCNICDHCRASCAAMDAIQPDVTLETTERCVVRIVGSTSTTFEVHHVALEHVLATLVERHMPIPFTKVFYGDPRSFLHACLHDSAGVSKLVYRSSRDAFTSVEGRESYEVRGSALETERRPLLVCADLVTRPITKALVPASIRDLQPDLVSCTYPLYCAFQPGHCSLGLMFGEMSEGAPYCVHRGIGEVLFKKLRENDVTAMKICVL